jgi:hypothetical protein
MSAEGSGYNQRGYIGFIRTVCFTWEHATLVNLSLISQLLFNDTAALSPSYDLLVRTYSSLNPSA